MYEQITIATDGSDLSMKAVEQGVALARSCSARVSFVTVTAPFHTLSLDPEQLEETPASFREHVRERAERDLAKAAEVARSGGIDCDTIREEDNHPYAGILRAAARAGADLIVMASHGRRGVQALLLGSETVKVLTHSQLPVLVVR